MPWQRLVADVALEVDAVTGRLAYRQVILTVPRQSGKTTLLLALKLHRALGFGGNQRIVSTAQSAKDAREKLVDDHLPFLQRSPFSRLFTVRLTNGSEALRWRNGSVDSLVSTTKSAGHGKTLDLAIVDEAFAQQDDRLEQAFKPAMMTRPEPQMWVVSTAGDLSSTWLAGKVALGRASVTDDAGFGTAYFEWSAPEKADPADPNTWWGCMPALGHTVEESTVAAEQAAMPAEEFARAFLNIWPVSATEEQPLTVEAWDACVDESSRMEAPTAIALDSTRNRGWSTIAAAGRSPDGKIHVVIVENRAGTHWVVGRVKELSQRYRVPVHLDPGSPAGSFLLELEQAGVELKPVSKRQLGQACGELVSAVAESRVVHLGDPILSASVSAGRSLPSGDLWVWSRRDGGEVSPLVASTLAVWASAQVPVPEPALVNSVW